MFGYTPTRFNVVDQIRPLERVSRICLFQRIAESTGKELPAEEIVKGYEVEKKARKRPHGAAQTVWGRAQRLRLQSRQKEREFGAPGSL